MTKTLFSGLLFLLLHTFASSQSAEELIAKHIEVTGGANWAKVNTMRTEAKISSAAAAGMTISWTMTAVRDKAARMDVSVMGMTQSSVINGKTGWANNPFAGQNDPEPITEDQAKAMVSMTDIDGTLNGYKEKGYTVEYLGTEDVEGTEAHKIKINKEDKVEYTFLDPESFYEIKNIQVESVDGKEVSSATVYSNFKTQDGIVYPFTIQQDNPMMGATTITITALTLNPPVDEKIFEMPAKK